MPFIAIGFVLIMFFSYIDEISRFFEKIFTAFFFGFLGLVALVILYFVYDWLFLSNNKASEENQEKEVESTDVEPHFGAVIVLVAFIGAIYFYMTTYLHFSAWIPILLSIGLLAAVKLYRWNREKNRVSIDKIVKSSFCQLKTDEERDIFLSKSKKDPSRWKDQMCYCVDNIDAIKFLLKHKANIEAKNENGLTPLLAAIDQNNITIAKLLLKHKAETEAVDVDGRTPLLLAVSKGGKAVEIIKLLLSKKVNIEASYKDNSTSLLLSAGFGYTDITKLLIDYKANIEAANESGLTPLLLAINMGHIDIARLLLDHKANIEATDKNRNTPLIIATVAGCTKTIELLLDHKANIEATDKNRNTPLIIATVAGCTKTIELLLDHKANIEATDKNRNTPLIIATVAGCTKTIELLLDHKANIEATDKSGSALLIMATNSNYIEVVSLLLERKANIDVIDQYGYTALMSASIANYTQIVKILLKHKANIEVADPHGHTALMLSDEGNHIEVVRLLLEYEAKNIDAVLMRAVNSNHIEIVKLLLDYEANIETSDFNGQTPLLLAVERGHLKLVKLLLGRDADITPDNSFLFEVTFALSGDQELLDILKSRLSHVDLVFDIVIDKIILSGSIVLINTNYKINKIGAELIYKVENGEEINWIGSKEEFESKTKLDGLKMVNNHNGTYSAFVYHNNALGNLIKKFTINSKKPEFSQAEVLEGACHIFFKAIPGMEFSQWTDSQKLIEDLLEFSVDLEVYDADHVLYPNYGSKELILIKEASISTLPQQLGLSGKYIGSVESKGIKQIKYHKVSDVQQWLEKEKEICSLLSRQIKVVVDGEKVYLEDRIEEALPLLMEWEDNTSTPKLLHILEKSGKVEYYYSYSHKRNLRKWKDAARVLDFKTIFEEPNKVYELQMYDKNNSELYNASFSTEQMIVLCEYDAIPTKSDLLKSDIIQELRPNEIFWGYGSGSFKCYTSINKLPHMMIIGASGSGKSNFINGFILSLLNSIDKVQKMYLIDLKSGIEFNRYKDLNKEKIEVFSRGTSPSKLLSALQEVEAMMYLREEHMVRNNIVKLDEDPVFIVIDEYAQIQLMPAKGSEITAKDEIVNTLVRIGTRARSANIKLIIQTQDPRAVEDELKVHLMSRALLKTSKEADLGFTLQNEDKALEMGIHHTMFDKGRYVFEDYNDGDTKMQELQFPFVDPSKNLHEKYRSNGENNATGINLDEYKEFIASEYPQLAHTGILGGTKVKGGSESVEVIKESGKSKDTSAPAFDFDSFRNKEELESESVDDELDREINEIEALSSEADKLMKELFEGDK